MMQKSNHRDLVVVVVVSCSFGLEEFYLLLMLGDVLVEIGK